MAMPARYNVIGAFHDGERAQRAMERLEQRGVDRSNVHLLRPGQHDDGDRISELRAEMQDQVLHSVGPVTGEQARGAVGGALAGLVLGGIVGALGGLVWGYAIQGSLAPAVRVLIGAVAFAIAGSIAGAVVGGGLSPARTRDEELQQEDEQLAATRDTLIAVHVADPQIATTAARVLEDSGAERVDAVNADGTPLPPQAEHPRPADPPGRWWRRGARG
jgi:hypothetical protein